MRTSWLAVASVPKAKPAGWCGKVGTSAPISLSNSSLWENCREIIRCAWRQASARKMIECRSFRFDSSFIAIKIPSRFTRMGSTWLCRLIWPSCCRKSAARTPSSVPLGTARWMGLEEATGDLRFRMEAPSPQAWIGQALDARETPLGYADDRHVCLVSGTRGGKGAGVIIPNLCLWPGSCVVVDPKGENATVTARRRGNGSEYARGLEQKVCILDPYNEVGLEPSLKARYNPLDIIDIEGDLAVADAGRIAAAIVVRENKNDPYWEEAARNLVKGLILHVLTARAFEGMRNLVTVRRLLTQGDWLAVQLLREAGEKEIPSAFGMLWSNMRRNTAFNGVVSGVGEQMITLSDRTRSGVMATAQTNTEFLDDAPMQRLVETSDFDLAELKTNPTGITLYLTLPQRFMETHFRWLRLMISLAIGEMERIKGRPRSGYPTLFVLDEFAGLRRMEVIEHAVAQAAGFGAKFLFITQNLPQLKVVYDEGWETFVSNCGLKIFFQIDDDFTRSYVSRLLGEHEVRRTTQSGSRSQSTSQIANHRRKLFTQHRDDIGIEFRRIGRIFAELRRVPDAPAEGARPAIRVELVAFP